MKKFIDFVLLLGTIVSVVVALKFSELPIAPFIPTRWAAFWISSTEEQQKYVLLYDIAVGFIMSALFYFIVEEIPNEVRLHRAKRLIALQINQLVRDMEQIVDITVGKYTINQNLKELAGKDFLILDGETKEPKEEISYVTTIYDVRRKKKITAFHQYGDINHLIKNNLKQILDKISIIKNYEYFYASDNLLVECVRKIENCNLIRLYAVDNEKKKDEPCFLYAETSVAMMEFVNLYLKLLKCKFHTEYSITKLDSKKETEKYRNERESGVLIQNVIDIQTKKANAALSNPTAIISGSKYTTKILVAYLKRYLKATYLSIDNTELNMLNKYKYIVFIIDSDSRDAVVNTLNNNEISANILLLEEQGIIKKSICDNLNQTNHITNELFFKAAFRVKKCPIMFFKQEPSERTILDVRSKIENILYEGQE